MAWWWTTERVRYKVVNDLGDCKLRFDRWSRDGHVRVLLEEDVAKMR